MFTPTVGVDLAAGLRPPLPGTFALARSDLGGLVTVAPGATVGLFDFDGVWVSPVLPLPMNGSPLCSRFRSNGFHDRGAGGGDHVWPV